MINRRSVVGAILVALVAGMVGCAGTPPSILNQFSRESFDAWVKKNDPVAEKKEPSGIYINFRERGQLDFLKPKKDTSWFQLDYTVYNFEGVVIATRSEKLSRLLGEWAPTTHFVDDLVPYQYGAAGFVCMGVYNALQYMRIGDSARIYVPASMGYEVDGSTTSSGGPFSNSGYTGEALTYALKPFYVDVRIKNIIDDPRKWEMEMVQDYVRQNWGQSARDSIAYGIYMRLVEDYPTGDSIKADSTVNYFFAERFLDHQLITTNVESVARSADYYSYLTNNGAKFAVATFTPTDFKESKVDTTARKVYATAFLKIKSGQTIEIISISRWTVQGNAGSVSNIPQILPFQPRLFQVRTLKWNESQKETAHDLSKLL